MQQSFVIGLEGGGTNTRVMVADLKGNVLGYKETGSAHPHKNHQAKEHIQDAVVGALKSANVHREQVLCFAAGLPGYQEEKDLEWANLLINIEGLTCPRIIVNDSEVAHNGAFLFEPGIMAISGTGSNVMGCIEEGRVMFNGSFGHYAATAARFLAYNAVYRILAGQVEPEDQSLVRQVMDYWGVQDEVALRELASRQFIDDRMERDRLFGLMAPMLTKAALEGIPLARTVCDEAVRSLETGIRLVGGSFREQNVKVCYVGSVIQSTYIREQLTEVLQNCSNKIYQVVEPRLSPVAGAIAIALKDCGVLLNNEVLKNLLQHPKSGIELVLDAKMSI